MKVARYSYRHQFGDDVDDLVAEIGRMLLDGRYVLSEEVTQFEHAFQAYLAVEFAVGVNSGTDALLLAMMSLGIQPGDEVITQANTFHATVAAICLAGARPVLVDAQEGSFQIDQAQVAAAMTSRTRAIIPVHLYGYPAALDSVLALAQAKSVDVIEDAAQAHGAKLLGQRVGTFGRLGCFSFHPSKNLAAAGDAGAIVTADPELARQLRQFRSLGQASQNDHQCIGLNSKLDAIQAVILRTKLPHLDHWNGQRQHVAALYRERLARCPVYVQEGDHIAACVYHLFQVGTPRRDELVEHLQRQGVDAVVRYPVPIHLQPAFRSLGWKRGEFPVSERLARELVCLPIRPDMSVAEVDYVTDCVASFFHAR